MNIILTPTEFFDFRDIGKKPNIDKIKESIHFAQNTDLYDLMGDFIFEVIENKNEPAYADLMSGSSFTVDSRTYEQAGIQSLLADFTYARYVMGINVNFTPFGAVKKLSNDSEPVDRNTIRDIVKQTQQDAHVKFKFIDKYLCENATTFANYSTGNNPDINTFGQRFSIVGK